MNIRRIFRRSYAFALLALAVSSTALAGQGSRKPTPAVKVTAPVVSPAMVDSLLGAMRLAYVLCPLQISVLLMEYNLKALRGEHTDAAQTVSAQHQCTDSASTHVEALYKVARNAPISPVALSMLKDIYAYWRANLSELQPKTAQEVTEYRGARYKNRTDELFKVYKEKEERLRLEL
jgi:hypothetical protein